MLNICEELLYNVYCGVIREKVWGLCNGCVIDMADGGGGDRLNVWVEMWK